MSNRVAFMKCEVNVDFDTGRIGLEYASPNKVARKTLVELDPEFGTMYDALANRFREFIQSLEGDEEIWK